MLSFEVLPPHKLLFSCVATWVLYLKRSASWKIPPCPTHKDLDMMDASRNPQLSRKELCLEELAQKGFPEYSRKHDYPIGLLLRKRRWWLWKGLNSKSLPVCGGNQQRGHPVRQAGIQRQPAQERSPTALPCCPGPWAGSWAGRHGRWPGAQCSQRYAHHMQLPLACSVSKHQSSRLSIQTHNLNNRRFTYWRTYPTFGSTTLLKTSFKNK